MNNSTAFKQAHAMTKQVIKAGDSYSATFGLCLKAIKADSKIKMTMIQVLLVILLAIITANIKQVKQINVTAKKGHIIYANKGSDKVAFEMLTNSKGGFVAKDLYNRTITIFKAEGSNFVSSNGYVYDDKSSKAWLKMYNENQARLSA